MHVHVIAVGKIKDRAAVGWLQTYRKRLERYADYHELELRDGSEAEVEERFRKAIPARAKLVALEVTGRAWSSPELSRFIQGCEQDAVQHVVFLIGGAYGLPSALSGAADVRLSLSAMTFPHRLARLMLVEQIYRAFTIARGEPYSH